MGAEAGNSFSTQPEWPFKRRSILKIDHVIFLLKTLQQLLDLSQGSINPGNPSSVDLHPNPQQG